MKPVWVARNKSAHTSWNIAAILEGNRSCFGPTGPKEDISREMILKAEEGDYNWIFGILRDNLACADVADSKGYTVLAAAAVSPFPKAKCQWCVSCYGAALWGQHGCRVVLLMSRSCIHKSGLVTL